MLTCFDFIHGSVRPGHLPHPIQDLTHLQTSGQPHSGHRGHPAAGPEEELLQTAWTHLLYLMVEKSQQHTLLVASLYLIVSKRHAV